MHKEEVTRLLRMQLHGKRGAALSELMIDYPHSWGTGCGTVSFSVYSQLLLATKNSYEAWAPEQLVFTQS